MITAKGQKCLFGLPTRLDRGWIGADERHRRPHLALPVQQSCRKKLGTFGPKRTFDCFELHVGFGGKPAISAGLCFNADFHQKGDQPWQ